MDIVKRGDQEIVLTRSFSAPREVVFHTLTEPAHIRQWLKPAGMTLVVCQVDLRPGGSFWYGFETAKGRKLEVRGLYDAVNLPSGYSYTESYDFSPLRVRVTATLDDAVDGTAFRQVLVYRSMKERDEDFPGVAESADAVYAVLERYLQTESAKP